MGWRDRDYNRKEPNELDDEFVDASYDADADEPDDSPDDDDAYSSDPEAPDEADVGRDEPALIRCPNCGKMVVEETEQCHHCGHFIMDDERAGGLPAWMWVGVVLALLVAIMWGLFG